jgi:DNA recombination protein RmuC
METTLTIITVILIGVLVFTVYKLNKPDKKDNSDKIFLEMLENLRKEIHDSSFKGRQEMQKQLDAVNTQLIKGISDSSKAVQINFQQSVNTIKEVTAKLIKLEETNKQVVGFAEQMKSLENILKNPKQRGILGEYFLETLLGNVLPPNQYKIQYKFPNGEIVDAAIFFKDKIIPIDSKFSLEKYNKIMEEKDDLNRDKLEKDFKLDIKKRIDETSKYIRPADGTTDFAFMFIPAEGIYYNLLIYKQGSVEVNTTDLIEYAFSKHVIIVSPTSFYAYLETVLHGLKAAEIEKNVTEIIKKVGDLGRHLNSYQSFMQKVGSNLGTTVNMYNSATKEFSKIDKDIYKITDGESSVNPALELLEKPSLD